MKKLKLPKPKLPKLLNPKLKRGVKRIFGFENCKKEKFLKSPELDEVAVSVKLAELQMDINWIKRLLWGLLIGGGAGFYFGG